MAFCPDIVRLNGSNGSGHKIAARFIGMVARAFIGGAGPVVASVHAGHRRRLGMYGTAVDEPPSSVGRVGFRVMYRQFT